MITNDILKNNIKFRNPQCSLTLQMFEKKIPSPRFGTHSSDRCREMEESVDEWKRQVQANHSTCHPRLRSRLRHLEYIGRHGISLSGSYRQGYSTAYNTQSHIKVVCNGYILTHILNYNSRGDPRTLPSRGSLRLV